jgi:branched-chain amino acid transport system permease protein
MDRRCGVTALFQSLARVARSRSPQPSAAPRRNRGTQRMIWLDTLVQGILLGGLYALFAAGLSLVFGIMRLVNLAHGDLIVFAAFAILLIAGTAGLHPFLAALLAAPLMFAAGWLLQRLVLNRVLGKDILPPLLVTFGLSVALQNGMLEAFSADSQRLRAGALESASIDLGPVTVGTLPLVTFTSAVAVIFLLNRLFYTTALGRAFRATSDDPVTASLMGIAPKSVFAIATGLAMVIVTIAALYLGMRSNFDPSIGPARLIYAFQAVIIGGLGSLWGTLAGGAIIGVAQTFGAQINPEWQILAGHLASLVVLILRPRGLFPRAVD